VIGSARYIKLAASLGRSAERFQLVISRVEDAIDEHEGEEDSSFPQAGTMRLLQEYGRGVAPKYADISERRAEQAETVSEWAQAREYWEIKARWSQIQNDDEGKRDALVKAAETHVQKAEQALIQAPPSYIAASSHLTRAIEGLRRVGGMQGVSSFSRARCSLRAPRHSSPTGYRVHMVHAYAGALPRSSTQDQAMLR
jgi:hypothetical protein